MAKRITERRYFERPADEVAQWLLGKIICHKIRGDIYRWRITETEAYSDDEAFCRNGSDYKSIGEIIFEGNNRLIITCDSEKNCNNVLIRGAITTFDSQPYKLMLAFSSKQKCPLADDYIVNLLDKSGPIYIENDGYRISEENTKKSKRINIQSDKKRNFTIKDPEYRILLKNLNKR